MHQRAIIIYFPSILNHLSTSKTPVSYSFSSPQVPRPPLTSSTCGPLDHHLHLSPHEHMGLTISRGRQQERQLLPSFRKKDFQVLLDKHQKAAIAIPRYYVTKKKVRWDWGNLKGGSGTIPQLALTLFFPPNLKSKC